MTNKITLIIAYANFKSHFIKLSWKICIKVAFKSTSVKFLSYDEWKSHHLTGGTFMVNSIDGFLSKYISPPRVALNVKKLSFLEHLWKSYVPSKVIVFSWQLLLGRLPMKGNLYKRGVFSEEQQPDCRWYRSFVESEGHFFRMCPFANGSWYKIFKWFGISSSFTRIPLCRWEYFVWRRGVGNF
jgi:hypothetical protein